MRDIYWGGADSAPGVHPLNLPAYYWTWFGYGLKELGGVTGIVTGPKNESEATSVFERAGNVHMLLRVQKMSPAEVPFLNGITYEAIPRLLVPRFIDSEKGVAHAANILLTVNYGLQSMEVATGGTSIAWGLVAEAFANFGYLGIGALAVFLAVFYGLFSRITIGVPMTSLRFVVGLLIMGAAVKADTMALFITSQFQAIIGVSIAALFLMRREANPFAAEDDVGMKSMKNCKWQTAGGMPAPGILATLIEGAPAGGVQQGSWSGEHGPGEERAANGMRETADRGAAGPRDVGTGGTVRTLPIRTPKRIARWMPRRVRAAVVAQYAAEEEPEGTETPKDGSEKPRQLAVPYQNYRRYRG
jgi:hypothetical protein